MKLVLALFFGLLGLCAAFNYMDPAVTSKLSGLDLPDPEFETEGRK